MPGVRRTPLDRAIREVVQLRLRGGLCDNASLDEIVHRSNEISRRNLLRAGGLAGIGLTMAGCTSGASSSNSATPQASAASSSETPRVVIVGAGLAGLTTAYRLHQAGVPSQIYEARDRVGGRCWSSRHWSSGMIGEHGGEFIDTRHVHLLGLANELGLQVDDLWATYDPHETSITWVGGAAVQRKTLMAPFVRATQTLTALAKRNGSYFAKQAGRRAKAFDEKTQVDWFEEATGASIDSDMGRIMAVNQAGWYGLDPVDLGASNFIDFYAVDYPHDDERYTIHGGNDLIPHGMADALPAGSVTLESPLESIRKTSAGTYELMFTGTSQPVVADRVVITVPFNVLKEVDLTDAGFSATKRAAIDKLGMGTGSKVLLEFDQPFQKFDNWSSFALRGDDPQFDTWESNSTDSHQTKNSLLTVFGGGRAGAEYPTNRPHGPAPHDVSDQTLQALEEMVPGISAAHTGQSWLDFWTKDPWVRGSYAAFLPMNTTSFLGIIGDAEGGAHFAGEHTSVYSQGFLNGGAESGSRVAAEILDALGKPYPAGLKRAQVAQRKFEPTYPWA